MRIEHIIKPAIWGLVVPALIFLFTPPSAFAFVSGPCAGCHTMHNSKEGGAVAYYYTAAGVLTLVPDNTPAYNFLLKSECVTCHTDATGLDQGYYTLGSQKVPAVFTTDATAPTKVTAGGNFWWTADGLFGNNYGHNVRGIAGQDTVLRAPGAGSIGCAGSCHDSLTFTDAATTAAEGSGVKTNGCQGCHLKVGHHSRSTAEDASAPTYGAGNAYRFLSGHDDTLVGIVDNGGGAYEDNDWELTTAANTDHNLYKAQGGNPEKHPFISIGRWCAGCHADFHAYGEVEELSGLSGGGDTTLDNPGANPWLRHPTNVRLPSAAGVVGVDDYDWVDGSAQPYDWNMPVARAVMNKAPIRNDDQVMCLSCHKAHGSQYPNSLRWAYDATDSSAHSGASTTGCFFCHRTKDDP